jgi:GTPase SAR1 family protein
MSLSIAIIGDPNIGKTELFRYLAESCTAKQCHTQSVSVKEFKANVEYPNNQNVIHFFRSANDDKQLQVRSNHTRKYWPTVAPTFETFNIADRPTMVWDLSGNVEFCRLAYAYESFRKVDGFVLCYDMTSKQSFDNLTKWHQQFVLARQDALCAVAKKQHAASSHADTKEHRDVYLASR